MYTEYHNSGSGRNPRPVSGKAIAALILGILSVLFSSVFLSAFFLPVLELYALFLQDRFIFPKTPCRNTGLLWTLLQKSVSFFLLWELF